MILGFNSSNEQGKLKISLIFGTAITLNLIFDLFNLNFHTHCIDRVNVYIVLSVCVCVYCLNYANALNYVLL